MIASSACASTKHIILPVAVLGVILSMLSISLPGSAAADLPPLPTLSAALRSAGGPVVPAAWAGVWATTDSVHLCSDPTILFTDSGLDTLCTGDPIQDEQGGITLSCSGTVDDTSVDITCTGSKNSARDARSITRRPSSPPGTGTAIQVRSRSMPRLPLRFVTAVPISVSSRSQPAPGWDRNLRIASHLSRKERGGG